MSAGRIDLSFKPFQDERKLPQGHDVLSDRFKTVNDPLFKKSEHEIHMSLHVACVARSGLGVNTLGRTASSGHSACWQFEQAGAA